MRSVSFLSVALFTAIAVSACGKSQDSSEMSIDSAVVKSQSSALATAVSSAENDGGANIAEQLSEIGNTAAALIPRTKGASRAQLKGAASTCRCATAAQKTCTFSSCKIGTATASGTVSWAGGKLVCSNVTFDVPATGETQVEGESVTIGATHIAVTCDFTYATGSLDGTLHASGTTTVNGVDYAWDASLAASDLAWRAKTFTGGSVDVGATVTTSSQAEGTDTFHASGSVSFP
jgi:hypothetical protein